MASLTKSVMAVIRRSGLNARMMQRRCKLVLFFQSCGSFSRSGCSCCIHSFQRLAEPSISSGSFPNISGMLSASPTTLFQDDVGMNSDSAFSRDTEAVPRSKKLNSFAGRLLSLRRTLKQSCDMKMSLCRSKRPRAA